jgi:uncharacterized membrane protein (DUF106 family)
MALVELIQAWPRASIILISALVSLFINGVNYLVLDKDKMRESREKQKQFREQMKVHKDNPQKMMEINKEMMSHMGENMRHSLKPMLITFLPIILVFGWIRGAYAETTIASQWFWYYFVSAIAFSILFRKLFKLP